MFDVDASWPQWPQQSAEFSHGADGFGDPERAHKLVYRIHENQWERVETMVLFPVWCARARALRCSALHVAAGSDNLYHRVATTQF